MWVDRNHQMCEYSYTYLFTEQGRSILINHAYEDDFPMDENEISPIEAFYMVDLDVTEQMKTALTGLFCVGLNSQKPC